MIIDNREYRKRNPGRVDRVTLCTIDGETHYGYVLHRKGTEEWVSVTDYGEVWEFGDGEQKVRYDEAKHKDNFPWLDKYKEG